MKKILLTSSELESYYQKHLEITESIWNKLEEILVQEYLKEGYWLLWAEEKAKNEVLELRSRTRNPHPMPSRIPNDYDMGGQNE